MVSPHDDPPVDPHAELHELAADEHTDHPPVALEGEETIDEKIAKLNKALTGRVNDLRKDFDSTKKAISASVSAISADLATLKTSVENNTASIQAQDALIETAGKKADAAKKAADAATSAIAAVERGLHDLSATFAAHTHPLALTVQGATNPPTPKETP